MQKKKQPKQLNFKQATEKDREITDKPLTDLNYNKPHNVEGRVSFLVKSQGVLWIWYKTQRECIKTLGKSVPKI